DDRVERLVQVADRGGQRAVPAADAEAMALDSGAAPPQRQPDPRRNGNHPQHGGLQRGCGRGARRLTAVRDQDDALGGYPWGYLPARHLPSSAALLGCPPRLPSSAALLGCPPRLPSTGALFGGGLVRLAGRGGHWCGGGFGIRVG